MARPPNGHANWMVATHTEQRYAFQWTRNSKRLARMFGVSPERAWVVIRDGELEARFGPWVVRTPLGNVAGAQITGPYQPWKVLGPAHLSFKDRGVTFGSDTKRGVCIRFVSPVAGIDPLGRIRHPALTVTVDEPDRLVGALRK